MLKPPAIDQPLGGHTEVGIHQAFQRSGGNVDPLCKLGRANDALIIFGQFSYPVDRCSPIVQT
jgi:hypothetical protein